MSSQVVAVLPLFHFSFARMIYVFDKALICVVDGSHWHVCLPTLMLILYVFYTLQSFYGRKRNCYKLSLVPIWRAFRYSSQHQLQKRVDMQNVTSVCPSCSL